MNRLEMKVFVTILMLFFLLSSTYSQNNHQLANQISLAKQYSRIGNHKEAKKIYEKLYKIQPWNNNLIDLYNASLLQLKEYDKSISVLNARLNERPDDLNTYGLLGSTYFTMGKQDTAIIIWQEAISKNSNSEIGYRVMSRYAVQNRAYEAAIDFLKQGQNMSENKDGYYFEIANLYLSLMDYNNAAKEYSNLLVNSPSHIEPVKQNLNRYLSRPMAADETIKSVEEFLDDEQNNAVSSLLAYLYTFQGNYQKAFEIIVDLDESSGNNGAMVFNFAETSFREKDNFAAQLAYKYLLENHSNSPFISASKIGYARSSEGLLEEKYSTKNDWKPISLVDTTNAFRYSEVIDVYSDYAKERKNNQYYTEANFQIGHILKNKFNKPEESIKYFENVFTYSPNSDFGLNSKINLIDIELRKGEINSGIKYFGMLSDSKMVTPEIRARAKFMYGQMLFWDNEFSKASEVLSQVMADLKDNTANDAIELSVLINTFSKDSVNLEIFAKAEFLTNQTKFDEAAIEFQKLIDNKTIFILPDIAKFKLAEIKIAQNNYNGAIEVLKALSEDPNVLFSVDKSIFLQAEIYHYGLADLENAKLQYEKILETFPNSIYFATSRDRINLILTNSSDNI